MATIEFSKFPGPVTLIICAMPDGGISIFQGDWLNGHPVEDQAKAADDVSAMLALYAEKLRRESREASERGH